MSWFPRIRTPFVAGALVLITSACVSTGNTSASMTAYAAAAGLRGIAVEAGGTLVVDRQEVVGKANQAGLFVIGAGSGGVRAGRIAAGHGARVGIAEEWTGDARDPSEWRDTHLAVRGPAVAGLRATFIENWVDGRDVWWHDLVEGQSTDSEPEVMNAEDLKKALEIVAAKT